MPEIGWRNALRFSALLVRSPSRSWRILRVLCGKALLFFLDRVEQTPDGLLRVVGAHDFAHHRDAARTCDEAGSHIGGVDAADPDDRSRREASPPPPPLHAHPPAPPPPPSA